MTRRISLRQPLRTLLGRVLGCAVLIASLASCSEDTPEYDPYHHWESRNKAWFELAVDSAHSAIASAHARYGSDWAQHCDWRMYKSLQRSPLYQSGDVGDSICVHILKRGDGTINPAYNDTVRINFRGQLMPTTDANGNLLTTVFTQTYYQGFDPATASPQKAAVSDFTPGFGTALQRMVEGDDWLVYIPQQLFYGSSANGVIPAYSAAVFRLNMVGVYPLGTKVPSWK